MNHPKSTIETIMKKLYILSTLVLIFISVLPQWANAQHGTTHERVTHVTSSQALDVGYTFMRTGAGTRDNEVRKSAMHLVYTGQAMDTLTHEVTDCYYVYSLQPEGFVIVAADERVEPILGYSYENDFKVDGMPGHVRGWLRNYERQIEAVTKSDIPAEPSIQTKWTRLKSGQSINTRNVSVGPLLTTTWGQTAYYNNLCPTDAAGPAGHTYTGCLATAMAQILNYWEYPAHGRGTHSYWSNYGTLTTNYNSANYNYTLMPASLTATSTPEEVNAVATLMRDCGVAVNMSYSSTESSSFDQDARAALINFFRFSPNMSFAEKAYFSDSEWDLLLHAELDNNRPVFYSGQGSGGHAFLCDGYDANGLYHFNFGWGGFADGYFLTSSLTPGGADYSSSQSAIFGIVPDSTGNVILGQTTGTSTFTVDEPLEFYHLLGHNAYEGSNYSNYCYNTVNFIPANNANQLVADIFDIEDQSLTFYDGNGNQLRRLQGGNNNDYTPVVTSHNALQIFYAGNMYYAGFKLYISQTDGCRTVSNITSYVEPTTVHLTWTENGTATQWEIEYGVKDFALGTGTTCVVTTNTADFSNLQPITEYDFYIRPVCDSTHYGQWNRITLMVEGPYWQEIVTSQPQGYVYNPATNSVEIHTAEELVWWAKTGNGIDGHLAADIDLSGYKWQPAELSNRNFDGHGHVITNLFVIQGSGFFSECAQGSVIENVGITSAYMLYKPDGCMGLLGGLCGSFRGIMRNCYVSNSTIKGTDNVGGLVGSNSGLIVNCYVNASVTGNRWTGLLTGASYGTVRNCYAAGILRILSWCYNAGIAAYADGGEISNCYSVETQMGVMGNIGSTFVTDTSTFVKSDSSCALLTPIVFDDITETDLLSALNRGLELYNDSVYCTWAADTNNINGGYPIFGNDQYIVQCTNITDLSVQYANVGNDYGVVIGWTENDDASQWRIRYRRHDRPDTAYTFVMTTSNPDTIFGIPLGYTYDFNVRAICGSNSQSGWSQTQTLLVDLPYWTDIVTSQPAGYVEDAEGNVEISSAEGLAWLSVIVNGLQGISHNTFENKTVKLTSDIDLDGYRWKPMGCKCLDDHYDWIAFSGTFDGQNHSISNMLINEENDDLGLFGTVVKGYIKNVTIESGSVSCAHSSDIGALIGSALNCHEISNCHSSATVQGYESVGALCGDIDNYTVSAPTGPEMAVPLIMSNCSSSGTVYGRDACGNLIGNAWCEGGEVVIRNCYAIGDVKIISSGANDNAWYRGGLMGYNRGCHVDNCYSTGSVETENSSWYGKVIGALDYDPHVHYVYAQDDVNVGWNITGNAIEDISNTSLFHHDGNTNTLLNSVSIDATNYFDLLDALNAWVVYQNDSTLKLWVLDTVTGYPVFGDFYVPSCYYPTDLTASQATVVGDNTIKTRLSWTQDGEPDHWEILYVAHGQSMAMGTVVSVNVNPCVMAGIPVGQPLDFYVRAVCGEGDTSHWCGPVTYIPDKLHWTEIVTSQPEGFQRDASGNVYISSAEGLSWLSSILNGLNGTQYTSFYGKQIFITKDIDLSAYRWTSMAREWPHELNASFKGNNHVISGLYCNELTQYQGLIGRMRGRISNVVMTDVFVYGSDENSPNGTRSTNGGLVGYTFGDIVNCTVTGNVRGCGIAGTAIGPGSSICNMENSYFIGNATMNGTPLGICENLDCEINNCYVVNTGAPVGSSQYYIRETTNSSFSGNSYTWTLNAPHYINGAFHSDLVEALNAWVDANNTNGQYLHWVADTAMVNGGYPIFESVTYPAVTAQDTVMAAGFYSWHGMVLFSDTVLTDTISTINGYDSVVTYHIFVTPTMLTEITVDTCSSYIWNGDAYNETGVYAQRFTAANGEDSVVVLNLTINPLTGEDVQIVCGSSYTWIDSVTYIADNNTATCTLTTVDGCDSTITLNLTILKPSYSDTVAVACNSFDWHELSGLTQSGNYIRTLTNAVGCDSVVTLHLTINQPTAGIDELNACDSLIWIDGNTYTENNNTATYTITNAAGCDSVVTLHLTVHHPNTGETSAVACDRFNWYGLTNLTQSGDYVQTLTNAEGCDSVVTLHLTVNYGTHNVVTEVSCDSYEWYEQVFAPSGTYIYEYTNTVGCPSVDTLHLTLYSSEESEFTISTESPCYIWNAEAYCASGDYTQTLQTIHGCDSVVTLHLTITAGIDDYNGFDFRVYPNPTEDIVNIQFTNNNSPITEIRVYDIYGKLMDVVETQNLASLQANAFDDPVQTQIDLSRYAAGVYFIKAVADGNVMGTRKVVKN